MTLTNTSEHRRTYASTDTGRLNGQSGAAAGVEELRCWTVEEESDALDNKATQGAASEAVSDVRTDQSVASASVQTSGSTASEVAASRRSGDARGWGGHQAWRPWSWPHL